MSYFNDFIFLQVILLESILNSINKDVKVNDVTIVIENCVELSMHSNISICNLSASRLAATLINKYIEGKFFWGEELNNYFLF